MRNLKLLILALVLTNSLSAQWQWISTPVYNNPYYECGYPSYKGCVASGNDIYWTMTASCASPGMGQFVDMEIYRTGNLGLSWYEIYSTQCGYYGGLIEMNFITPSFGYFINNVEGQYKFYRTDNLMTMVQECIMPTSDYIYGATMLSYDDIFAINEAGSILHLENDTLKQIYQLPFPLLTDWEDPNLTHTDNHSLFLTCKSSSGISYENDLILKSVDEGYTWDTSFISDMDYITDLKFSNDSIGFAIGEFGLILKTTNAGSSWDQVLTNYNNYLISIDFMNDQQWIIGGAGGLILYSEDEGETWVQLSSQTNLNIKKIYFPDKDELIVALTSGNGLRKSNLNLITTLPENNVNLSLIISPNPAKHYIDFSLNGSYLNALISIISIKGEILVTENVRSQDFRFDIGSLTEGMYFVKVQSEKDVIIEKFIKN